jgi:hypothetical protein
MKLKFIKLLTNGDIDDMLQDAMSTARNGHINDLYLELSKPETTCVVSTRGMCSIIPLNPLHSF